MSDPQLAELKASIRKNLGALERQVESLQVALDRDLGLLGKTQNAALIVAGLAANYYTCLETVFLRISQFFENTLRPITLTCWSSSSSVSSAATTSPFIRIEAAAGWTG